MSSVIKSAAVVDRRDAAALAGGEDASVFDHAVIKRNHVPMRGRSQHTPSRDAYLDELNQLQIDIDEAKREREELGLLTEEIKEEIAVLELEREKLRKYEGLNIEEEVANKIKAAEKEADRIKTDAVAEAKQSAEEVVDAMKAEAYLDGLEQGANEARQQVREENQGGINAVKDLIETLTAAKDDLVAENERDIVELIMSVAEKVIGKRLEEDPKTVVDMLRDAMEETRREEYVKVTVSRDLLPVQAKASDAVKKLIEGLGQRVEVTVDPDAAPKTLTVESPGGFTDLSVETQLENIRGTIEAAEGEAPDPEAEEPEETKPKRTRKPKAAKATEEEV